MFKGFKNQSKFKYLKKTIQVVATIMYISSTLFDQK